MKKFLVALVAMFCVTAVSAQFSNVGVRFNGGAHHTGANLIGQYDLGGSNHIEGRLGFGGGTTSITGLYNWEIEKFNWTPSLGQWFFDAGVGANVAFASGYTGISALGTAQLGIKFNNAPVSVTFDLEPTLFLTGNLNFDVYGGVSVAYHF